jgi:hypothetical protein
MQSQTGAYRQTGPWVRVARYCYALERASRDKTFLDLKLDLDRFTELVIELSVCKIWQPPSLR